MKKLLLTALSVVFLVSCKDEAKQVAKAEEKTTGEKELYKELYGNWVGDFKAEEHARGEDYVYSNKINIVIKKIVGNKVIGQNIVAGNNRPLSGEVKVVALNEFQFELKEPGDDKKDGIFTFTIKNDTLSGEWTANNKKASVTKRAYKLTKQQFKYDPNLMLPSEDEYGQRYMDSYSMKLDSIEYEAEDGAKEVEYNEMYRTASDVVTTLNSSTTVLKESDLKNLKKLELEILRNTIFARHGYTFKKKTYRQFFDPVDWYVPVSDDVTKELTVIEKQNIKLLQRFEKYAEDNYDTFGR
ncbi:YARHG domain-containing protein [Flavobacterium amniphilum]|uniref:YARHG domain-containing protein n=1 Tax=Flavobacterium amniphilum TaxID=1834035 RepID=UPI00202A993D|nr:YARHG domain-containing protein [Flavobacterium amniphilum]MCL9807266.1 YARHG domain-containing protein [Flavobacterium amniphilum]